MKMEATVLAALVTLGFASTIKKPPKLKIITKKYYDLAKKLHPDRPGGGDAEKFKDITLAYRIVGEFIEATNLDEDDYEDIEEMVARKVFKEFEFGNVKENLFSFTIHLDNELSFLWDKILTKNFGEPLDRTSNNNGKHWKYKEFKDEYQYWQEVLRSS